MGIDSKCTILVTGFGPFDIHVINASWEAVKELEKLWTNTEEFSDVKLITEEIPVSYSYVSTYIPLLWKKHNPMIVLHVGVSHKAECLTIECQAYNNGYQKFDVHAKCPNETDIECKVLKTEIDINELCYNVNKNSTKSGCKACVSYDAGRYLCEYIFYQSLSIDSIKSLFVHVPDFHKYTSEQTAKGLYDILCYLLKNSKYR